jgi:hypothetical protein
MRRIRLRRKHSEAFRGADLRQSLKGAMSMSMLMKSRLSSLMLSDGVANFGQSSVLFFSAISTTSSQFWIFNRSNSMNDGNLRTYVCFKYMPS